MDPDAHRSLAASRRQQERGNNLDAGRHGITITPASLPVAYKAGGRGCEVEVVHGGTGRNLNRVPGLDSSC